jgi:transcription initiation factor TFIID subunit TAF12
LPKLSRQQQQQQQQQQQSRVLHTTRGRVSCYTINTGNVSQETQTPPNTITKYDKTFGNCRSCQTSMFRYSVISLFYVSPTLLCPSRLRMDA